MIENRIATTTAGTSSMTPRSRGEANGVAHRGIRDLVFDCDFGRRVRHHTGRHVSISGGAVAQSSPATAPADTHALAS